jgi:hypothetical protein
VPSRRIQDIMGTDPMRWMGRITFVVGCLLLVSPEVAGAQGRVAYVLNFDGQILYTFDTANPQTPLAEVFIGGVAAGETLVGIDIRPANGMLYSLGVNPFADTMTLYHLSPRTGVATPIGAGGFTGVGDQESLFGPAIYGLDFDPTTDQLRITCRGSGPIGAGPGLNFRIDPDTGTLAGVDATFNPGVVRIHDIAYTNNGLHASATTLYAIDTNAIYIQSPPNLGTLTQVVPLAEPLSIVFGFDLDPLATVVMAGGAVTAGSSEAYAIAALGGAGPTRFLRINLRTGTVSSSLPFIKQGGVRGLAVSTEIVPGELPATALNATGTSLLRFSTAAPGAVTEAVIDPAGLVAGDVLVALDIRPQSGQLYAMGFNAANNTVQVYRLTPRTNTAGTTAAATAVGGAVTLTLPGATAFGFDFIPTEERIRVIANTGESFRLDPANGTRTALDAAVNPPGAVITGAAYTNNFGQPIDAGGPTTLYTLDAANDRLAIQHAPDDGTQTVLLPVTVNGAPLDFTSTSGFDIPARVFTATANAAATGRAFATLTVGGTTRLYAIELSTGAATPIGLVGTGTASMAGLALGDGTATITTVTVSPLPNPAPVGTPVTITATVTPAAATGTVAFTNNNVAIPGCQAQPLTGGVATCQTTFATGSAATIRGVYGGDGVHLAATSAAVTQFNQVSTTLRLIIEPHPVRAGSPVTLRAFTTPESDVSGPVTFLANGVPIGTANAGGGHAVLTRSLPAGVYEMTALYAGSQRHLPSSTAAPVTLNLLYRQHFAEGATGSFFQTDIGVLNASETATANVTVRLFAEGVPAHVLEFPLAPLARRSLDLNAILGVLNIVGGVSTLIESDQPIAATRQMTWGTPVYGSTLESGVANAARRWVFAEGATGAFSLYYLIENPEATEAQIQFTHLLEGGAPPIVRNEVVAPFSRRTFFINEVPGAEQAALSTDIQSSVPIVAERAMYLNTTTRQWEGGSASAGSTTFGTEWSLAEGATGFFFTYLLLANPINADATVTVQYQLPDGTTIAKEHIVPGLSRRTIDVRGEDAQLQAATMGMSISSTRVIFAERAMWWGGLPFTEGSVAFGTTEAGEVWAIGEGIEGQTDDEATFVLVANGTTTAGTVRFTAIHDDGTREQREFALAATARLTVRMADAFPNARGRAFSVLVESLTAGVPITVEYSRYQSADRFLGAGGAALATRVR